MQNLGLSHNRMVQKIWKSKYLLRILLQRANHHPNSCYGCSHPYYVIRFVMKFIKFAWNICDTVLIELNKSDRFKCT